ncbi:MAG TPA: long-chain-acyl-CoA synthetase [Stellaceae bacterium]|nr:long-chain-acyl-CoA synthetase [Stellaceae bacterium]
MPTETSAEAAPATVDAEADRRARAAWLRALQSTAAIGKDARLTLPFEIERAAETFADRPALIGDSVRLSYQELAERARRYAAWAARQRLGPGEVVALMMRNCPEYMAVWLGITGAGGVVALVNTQLAGASLRHALATVSPRHVIAEAAFAGAVDAVLPQLGSAPMLWVHGEGRSGHPRIDDDLRDLDDDRPLSAAALRDPALCIYTSGTTGLPKAANVSHLRIMQWSRWFAGMMDAGAGDRMYNCLPMYHSVGGVVATGAMLVSGGSVVIRERFSARRFWDDVAANECTIFQYIGELCRYLVKQPVVAGERDHRLRLACGNGLRPDVWPEFRRRFAIPRHLEFYAATEANFSLYNCEEQPGAIGRIPPFLMHRFPVALIKVDAATGEALRDSAGLCVRCAAGEVGEAVNRIPGAGSEAGSPFEGYTDPEASARKILRNVFAHGDACFRSGDLMRQDARGFFYFVDRIGDTFRWKGENVSTMQVAEAIARFPGIGEAAVYGVAVPGADGRAGMAAVVPEGELDIAGLRRHLSASLPEFASPLFLRVCRAIDLTATFKHKKQELAAEGYNPSAVSDPLYLDDRPKGTFVPVDRALYDSIAAGRIRL